MYPTQIRKYSDREIMIAWTEGKAFVLSFLDLRFFCQCAVCVDENTGQRMLLRSSLDPGIRVVEVQMVGRYAIQCQFSDGHSTGIYHFDRLLDICQKNGRKLEEGLPL